MRSARSVEQRRERARLSVKGGRQKVALLRRGKREKREEDKRRDVEDSRRVSRVGIEKRNSREKEDAGINPPLHKEQIEPQKIRYTKSDTRDESTPEETEEKIVLLEAAD